MPGSSTVPFLSATSANALISDLRPTTLAPSALQHINILLDELLASLISAADSINPSHLRLNGIPAVFSGDKAAGDTTGLRALGRSAVGEAELELRSWYETHAGGRRKGFPSDGQGRGMTGSKEMAGAAFPVEKAADLMKFRCATFSTLAPQTPPPEGVEDSLTAAWKSAGGDVSEETLAPAGLWLTAILEHVCEHILSQLARVVARDSGIASAGVQDLYVALCEDESVWGLFKKMKVKEQLESAIRTSARPKRAGTPQRPSTSDSPTDARSHLSNSPHGSKVSIVGNREPSLDRRAPPSSFEQSRGSPDHPRLTGVTRKPSTAKKASTSSHGHERSGSVLSMNTRNMLGAFHDTEELSAQHEEEEEFDAMMRSNETMKVSLTPSRLKTFEMMRGKGSGSPTQSAYVRPTRPTQSPEQRPAEQVPPVPRTIPEQHRTPPSASRSRSGSSARLTARGATTISEESSDDADLPGTKRQQKHSLMELLSSEPAPLVLNGASRRTAPAVVLGTPPPQVSKPPVAATQPTASTLHAQPSQPSLGGSINRPSRRRDTVDTDDEYAPAAPRRSKPKSEAQELADFFNSTPPPPASNDHTPAFDEPLPTSKSTRGFRSLMSKVTGSSKKDKDKADRHAHAPSLSTPASQSHLPDPISAAKRQRSMQSMASSTYHTPHERAVAPPLPDKHVLRKPSPSISREASVGAGLGMAAGASAIAANAFAINGTPRPADSAPTQAPVSTMHNGHITVASQPQQPAIPSTDQLPHERLASAPKELQKQAVATDGSVADDESDLTPSAALASMTPVFGTPSTDHDKNASDAHSFKTADEGEQSIDESDVQSDSREAQTSEEIDSVPEAREEMVDNRVQSPIVPAEHEPVHPPTPPAPSVPVSELAVLRGLLDHATSARECRMLLSAVLTQWGVPAASATADFTPEYRLAAWLLAGRDGPMLPVYAPSSKPDEELATPKADPHVVLPGIEQTQVAAAEDDREELMTETDTEGNSELSVEEEGVVHEVKRGKSQRGSTLGLEQSGIIMQKEVEA